MRIVVAGVDGAAPARAVDVTVDPSAQATVADLVGALVGGEVRAEVGLEVDGRFTPPSTALDRAGLLDGSTVRLVEGGRAQGWAVVAHLVVVAGEGAGTRVPLVAGDHTVGRDAAQADIVLPVGSVSGRHCGLHVTAAGGILLADLGSRNGTAIGGVGLPPGEWRGIDATSVLRIGGVAARVELPVADGLPGFDRASDGLAGTRALNRPPRPANPAAPGPLTRPDARRSSDTPPTFSWVAFLAPLAFGGITALLFNPLFALFALLSPVLVGGTYLEGKRRIKRRQAAAATAYAADLASLAEAARAASGVELDRRRTVLVDVGEVVRRAVGRSTRLWERRPDHGDVGLVTVGLGTERWQPTLAGSGLADDAVVAALADATVLADAPVAVTFAAGHAVGVHGDADAARAVARSLLLQAAVHTGPADLRVAVLSSPERAAGWAFARWLPHTRELGGADGLGGRLVATDPAAVEAVVRVLGEGGGPARTIVVVDGEALLDGRLSPARRLLAADESTGVSVLAVAATAAALPAACTAVVGVGADAAAVVDRPGAGTATAALAALVPVGVADEVARVLAGLDDPEQELAGAGLPDRVTLTDVLGFDPSDAGEVAAAWGSGTGTAAAPIGVGPDGAAILDLDRQGPHALVAGTTGAGKSELLRTLVAGLAATGSPDVVSFLLVDFKGGGAFDALADLPHVVGVVTDLDDGLAEVALRSLDGELRRRERLLREAGVDSWAAFRGIAGAEPLPRLLIVVDEFATLAAQHPGFLDGLVGVAQRGRSLGVHLVLATQRPSGSVSRDIQANVALRISLRVADERDSVEVLGVPAAARIGRGQVGRALVRSDAFDLVPVQVASSGEAPPRGARAPVTVTPVDPDGVRRAPTSPARTGTLAGLVAACVEAATRTGSRPPEALWGPEVRRAGIGAVALDGLLGLGPLDGLDAAAAWAARADADLLRVPIGIDDTSGDPVRLDLKEVALGGTGPHGLVVGTTGSGKSELLRTLVVALAATHHPDDLALVLVDFKGGATFAGLGALPHVAGSITNLAGDEALLDRFHLALGGEQRRRQEVLAAGGAAGIVEHRAARRAGADLPALPHLVVVIDEFAELLAARPDFLELFVAIGRLGRSLGVHLLFASQQLDEGRLRGLEGNLGYRVALRTATANDSRAVLGTTAAATLPPEPGLGFLKDVGGEAVRFKAALVSSPAGERSAMDAVIRAAVAAAPKVHQVWLPPLDAAYALDELIGPVTRDGDRGWSAAAWPDRGRLRVPIGVVDRPAEQRRATHVVDLAGAEASLAIVGGPQSGKTTAVRTLLAGLFATHTPTEVAASLVDFGGGLAPFAGDPHVGVVADRSEPALAVRALRDAIALLDRREARFRSLGIDSMAEYRAQRRDGLHLDDPVGDLVVVIDGWTGLKAVLDDADNVIAGLASRGAALGVHVVVTANRWADLRTNLRDALGGRLELRLADAGDSAVDRKAARTVPIHPGRGLLTGAHHVQVALPRLDGRRDVDGLGASIAAASAAHAEAWTGGRAPAVRLLPTSVLADDLRLAARPTGHQFVLGADEDDLAPVVVDLATGADPHLLVLGDGGSGRTLLLERFVRDVGEQAGPDGASFCIVDPRRTLLEQAELPWVDGYAAGAQQAAAEAARIRALLAEREPGPEVAPAQLRERSWWEGPEVYVVVDDYDLLVGPSGNPLTPLLDVLAAGRDVGFHLVVARRVAGASRGLFEPVLQRVRELGGPVLLLAGDPAEGPILGQVRPGPLPPGRGHLLRRGQRPLLVQVAEDPN